MFGIPWLTGNLRPDSGQTRKPWTKTTCGISAKRVQVNAHRLESIISKVKRRQYSMPPLPPWLHGVAGGGSPRHQEHLLVFRQAKPLWRTPQPLYYFVSMSRLLSYNKHTLVESDIEWAEQWHTHQRVLANSISELCSSRNRRWIPPLAPPLR